MKQLSPKEIDDTTEILNALNTSYDGWAEEKQWVEDASFEDGFENLCFWIHSC